MALGRTRRLARRQHFAVANLAILELGRDAREVDALHAVGALLHHAAAADGDVRIARQLEAGRVPIRIQQEVEATDLVRTVVRAVARADAAVVDHVVQAFVAVRRRRHRAHHLARRRLALLTRHRLVVGVRILDVAAVVPVDAEPVHLAAVRDLRLADDRHVVLGLAGDDAGVAAGADVLVDRHAPRVAVVLASLEHRETDERLMLLLGGERRLLLELFGVADANEVASFERPVILRGDELVAVAGLASARHRSGCRSGRRAQRVDAEPDPVADRGRRVRGRTRDAASSCPPRVPAPSRPGCEACWLPASARPRRRSRAFRRAAVPGDRSAALSHVSFVSDLGSSWSQALLAKRPS